MPEILASKYYVLPGDRIGMILLVGWLELAHAFVAGD